MKIEYNIIIGLLSILTLLGCVKEGVYSPLFDGTCTGNIYGKLCSDTDYWDTAYFSGGDWIFEHLCLDTFNINISGSCDLTFGGNHYYLVIDALLEHYNIYNKVLLWSKSLIIEEKGTFTYDNFNCSDDYFRCFRGTITFYPKNKEQYSTSYYWRWGRGFDIPYSIIIEDYMKYCIEYKHDTLISTFECGKDTICNIRKLDIELDLNWDCFHPPN